MKFPSSTQKGKLVKRYKRFLADIDLGGTVITAHCANTGSMMGVKEEGSTVWVTKAQNPNRKLGYDWQVIEVDGAKVCINTALANKIVVEAIEEGQIGELSGYENLRREVKYGKSSRIDILLEDAAKPKCYVEIKNVTLSRTPPLAEFPDSPTARGTKHLFELAEMALEGHRAVMLYLVNRTDCTSFDLARDIDPDYALAFAAAVNAGVEALAYGCEISPNGIVVNRSLKIVARKK
jgi:sugar fermentation stimulation protein A